MPPQEAKAALERALADAVAGGGAVADIQIAAIRVALGRAYWLSGGEWRSQRKFAHTSWLAAAAITGSSQVCTASRYDNHDCHANLP